MSQYKVIQDIEAEDKLVGPLSLRQFIYAGIAATLGWLSFLAVSKGAPFLLAATVPPMLFCMFFAWPWSPDQPTEVWALARIRFYFKPRRRVWDQSGVKELVTITVPKKVERILTNGLSQTEVRSRLSALADTIDSRGWAIKNAAINMPAQPTFDTAASDRLVAGSNIPQPVSELDITANDDILDEQNNPIAQQFDEMIQASTKAHRQQVIERLNAPAPAPQTNATNQPANDYWFMHQGQADADAVKAGNAMFANPQVVHPGAEPVQVATPTVSVPTVTDEAMAKQIIEEHHVDEANQNLHLKTINPVSAQPAPVTPQSDAAILNLASNDDLDIATIARQARKERAPETPDDEVVIPLH